MKRKIRNIKDTRKKIKKNKTIKRIFSKKDYISGDGMLTSVWGPSMWHYLHVLSFNYPNKPSKDNKKYYGNFVKNLVHTLPCKYCRENLKNNFKKHPLKQCHLKDRTSFSKYIFELHETVNKMLGKKSGLTYCQVRERYEHFRSRCTKSETKKRIFKFKKTKKNNKKKEKGCTEPLYGKKSKCIIKIVPQDNKCKTFQMDKKCYKKK